MKLRAVCESEVQRAASDATSGVEGLQLRWRQVTSALHVIPSVAASRLTAYTGFLGMPM